MNANISIDKDTLKEKDDEISELSQLLKQASEMLLQATTKMKDLTESTLQCHSGICVTTPGKVDSFSKIEIPLSPQGAKPPTPLHPRPEES